MRFLSVLVAACFSGLVALAAPPELKLKGPDKPVANALVVVTSESTAKTIKWKVVGAATVEQDTAGRKIYLVAQAGKVIVLAVASSETGELSDFAELAFDFGDGAIPLPPPNPDSAVPPELVKSIQTAYNSDTTADKTNVLSSLAVAMDGAAIMTADKKYKTAGDLETAVRTYTLQKVGGAGKLPAVGIEIGNYLAPYLPLDKDSTLTDSDRTKAATGYKTVASAIRRIK